MFRTLPTRPATALCLAFLIALGSGAALAEPQASPSRQAEPGDAPADPGPLASTFTPGLSPALRPAAIEAAMRKVADWQSARLADTPGVEPSRDWTFATLYLGLLTAAQTLHQPAYRDLVLGVAEHYHWTLGPRLQHADDQAIGQSYLALYREQPDPERIAPMRAQFDQAMQIPDDPAKPVWWWCDALFMAPPAWAGLAEVTHNAQYLDYMHRQWRRTYDLLWDPQEHLFSRDASYLDKRENNGRKLFWSRGNGWVMGGLAQMLDRLPAGDPHRAFYLETFRRMADAVASIQGPDGLWRPGLLDAASYPQPEVSGSAFFVYAFAWGIDHHILDRRRFEPVVARGWAGLVAHIYADGRLGDIQPIGAAPGAYTPGASYVYGVGAFLLAGAELDKMAHAQHARK